MTTPQPDETTAVPAHPSDLRLWWSRSERAVYRTYTDTGTVFKAVEMTAQWKLPRDVAPLVVSVDGVGATTPADLCHSALAELIALKDGPRDDHYRECKEQAWATARAALASSAIGESSSLPEPLHEVSCPQCGATIRARMADAPDEATACCDELNPDTGYRCRRTPIHDAGKSIRKHVQIDKLGQVDWWITPARALLSGGEQR